MTVARKENRATVASLPEWDEVQRGDLWVKVNGALASTFWEVTWQGVKVNSALASTIMRVSWLASESRECFGKHVLERWSWLASESHQCICKQVLDRWGDFWVKDKSALASTIWRVSWLASGRAEVLLVDTSKATQEQALQVWERNIQKQQ